MAKKLSSPVPDRGENGFKGIMEGQTCGAGLRNGCPNPPAICMGLCGSVHWTSDLPLPAPSKLNDQYAL